MKQPALLLAVLGLVVSGCTDVPASAPSRPGAGRLHLRAGGARGGHHDHTERPADAAVQEGLAPGLRRGLPAAGAPRFLPRHRVRRELAGLPGRLAGHHQEGDLRPRAGCSRCTVGCSTTTCTARAGSTWWRPPCPRPRWAPSAATASASARTAGCTGTRPPGCCGRTPRSGPRAARSTGPRATWTAPPSRPSTTTRVTRVGSRASTPRGGTSGGTRPPPSGDPARWTSSWTAGTSAGPAGGSLVSRCTGCCRPRPRPTAASRRRPPAATCTSTGPSPGVG